MTKSYQKIIKEFQKTIDQCDARFEELVIKQSHKEAAIADLRKEADAMAQERCQVVNLSSKLQALIGGEDA